MSTEGLAFSCLETREFLAIGMINLIDNLARDGKIVRLLLVPRRVG